MNKTISVGFFLALFFVSMASAIPPEPMAFYGSVNYANGTAIPNGYYITAKIENVVSGECEIVDSVYGKAPSTKCIVVTHSVSYPLIEFYLGTYKIGEARFEGKEIVNLDFNTVENLPPRNLAPVSNGICETYKGECSYNILDCDNSLTKECLGDKVCNAEIGETCLTAPEDCGVCPSTGGNGGSGGGGSSGGSGGGGGGGGSSKPSLNNTLSGSEETVSTEDLNQEEDFSQKGFFNFLTGFVTGAGEFVSSTLGIVVILFVVFVIGLLIFLAFLRKKKKK